MRLVLSFLVFLLLLQCFVLSKREKGKHSWRRWRHKNSQSRPNIIFVLADDLDVLLGTPKVMRKTRRIFRLEGAEFNNAFVTTPLCCPSRSSILTGRYVHNHHVRSNNRNCSSQAWRQGPERLNFGTFLRRGGYKTGYFGKYLNDYDGSYIPPGWDSWIGLIKNSRFYNYTLNNNGKKEYHGANYRKDYFTDVITNKGIRFFIKQKARNQQQPVMMVLAMAAPHGPEDPAPQYKDLFKGIKAPRTPNYNYTSKDKHWIVRVSKPLDDLRADFTDLLYRRRLLTMLSLDDAIAKIYNMLKDTNELENTYIFFSSDHGFHIGQFNLIKGKSQPYETDIRIPLYVRGPGVIASQRIDQIALNIDLAPTFLDIAGVKRPPFMDGTSLLPLLRRNMRSSMANPIQWRDTFLVQRGIMILLNNTMTFLKYSPINTNQVGKKRASICQSPNRPLPPCTRAKKRVCVMVNGVYVLQDCTAASKTISIQQKNKGCQCRIPDPEVPGEQALPNNVLTKLPLRAKAKMKVFSDRQMYRLMMSGHLSVDQLRKVFARELARIKRKFRKRSLRYLRHLRVDKATVKVKAKKQFEKRNNGTVLHKKMKKIDRKISDARKRLDALRERRRMLKSKTSTGVATPLVREPIILPQSKQPKKICECEPKKERRKKTKQKKKSRRRNLRNMKCFYHTPDHWRTPPFWTRGSFSSCKNSPNNTFWCLRKINTTHNFIYCRFVTSFVEYYDLIRDPYQLTNQQHSLSPETTNEFERQLAILRDCKGREDCTMIDGRTLRQIKEDVESTQASSFSDRSWGKTS